MPHLWDPSSLTKKFNLEALSSEIEKSSHQTNQEIISIFIHDVVYSFYSPIIMDPGGI